MRNEYYSFIKKYGISDVFKALIDLSYTKKLFIMQELVRDFSPTNINNALKYYQKNYILTNRVNYTLLLNILKKLCKVYHA